MFSKGTKNYNLPTWSVNEHPDFITDMSDAFVKIDAQMKANETQGEETAATVAEQVPIIEKNTNDITTLTHTTGDMKVDIVNLEAKVTEAINTADVAVEDAHKAQESLGDSFSPTDTVSQWKESLKQMLLPVTEQNNMQSVLSPLQVAITNLETQVNGFAEDITELEGTVDGYTPTNNIQSAIQQVMAKALEAIDIATNMKSGAISVVSGATGGFWGVLIGNIFCLSSTGLTFNRTASYTTITCSMPEWLKNSCKQSVGIPYGIVDETTFFSGSANTDVLSAIATGAIISDFNTASDNTFNVRIRNFGPNNSPDTYTLQNGKRIAFTFVVRKVVS